MSLGTAAAWVVTGPLAVYLFFLEMWAAGAVLVALSAAAFVALWVVLTNRVASRWAVKVWGHPLRRGVWWSITWRTFVVGLVAGVILMPVSLLGTSLESVYEGSARGALGSLLNAALAVVNVLVTILADGWAMSRVVARQLGG
ncbi:MAG TPA: hypothetical protein VNN07_03970, partial [Candidatus Tectomicrobia bacterium]|nr:hypothetical protein [Candidatus Tectomicrobia bacterium]